MSPYATTASASTTMPACAAWTSATSACPTYQLRFASLFDPGRAMAFRCDERGRVEMDASSDASRRNYLYARAMVGREFATPTVVLSDA